MADAPPARRSSRWVRRAALDTRLVGATPRVRASRPLRGISTGRARLARPGRVTPEMEYAVAEGRPVLIRHRGMRVALLDAGRLASLLALNLRPRLTVTPWAPWRWTVTIDGLPGLTATAVGKTRAADRMLAILRQQALTRPARTSSAEEPPAAWAVRQLAALLDDGQIRAWLTGTTLHQRKPYPARPNLAHRRVPGARWRPPPPGPVDRPARRPQRSRRRSGSSGGPGTSPLLRALLPTLPATTRGRSPAPPGRPRRIVNGHVAVTRQEAAEAAFRVRVDRLLGRSNPSLGPQGCRARQLADSPGYSAMCLVSSLAK